MNDDNRVCKVEEWLNEEWRTDEDIALMLKDGKALMRFCYSCIPQTGKSRYLVLENLNDPKNPTITPVKLTEDEKGKLAPPETPLPTNDLPAIVDPCIRYRDGFLCSTRGIVILEKELDARREQAKGRKVIRDGEKVIKELPAPTDPAPIPVKEETPVPADPAPQNNTATNLPEYLTIREAAEYARRTERTIRSWRKRKDSKGDQMLPGTIQTGRKILILRTDLDRWPKGKKDTRTPAK
jgi:hypothetical protein